MLDKNLLDWREQLRKQPPYSELCPDCKCHMVIDSPGIASESDIKPRQYVSLIFPECFFEMTIGDCT